jgi:predicted O-linked N-acetylglucosamine transferase (SPINDLY family)
LEYADFVLVDFKLFNMRPRPQLERELAQAIGHHCSGRFARAELLYRRVLSADPRQPKALLGLSTLAVQSQRNELAADLLARALELEPDNSTLQSNLAEVYRRLGQRRKAVDLLLQVLARDPDFAEAFYDLAQVIEDNGELSEAVVYFERATDLRPDVVSYQQGLAAAVAQLGDRSRAAGHYACAWLLDGRHARALDAMAGSLTLLGRTEMANTLRRHYETGAKPGTYSTESIAQDAHLKALSLEQRGDIQAAVAQYEVAAYSQPDSLIYQKSFARALHDFGALGQAVAHYHCALAIAPRCVEILVSLSTVLRSLGRSEGAAAASIRALEIDPNCARAHACLGAARVDQHRNDAAISSCKRAIELDPYDWLAHFQLGNALFSVGEVEAALGCYRRTIELNPKHHTAHSNLIMLLSFVPGVSIQAIGDAARDWARQRADPLASEFTPHENERNPQRRLRIGYFSPDFIEHSVALFVLPLLEQHDRAGFEVICYSNVRRPDAITRRMQTAADGWRDIAGAGDAVVADLVRGDRIDLLIDLAMHTGGGRPLLFARKPAPIQICWLAYVGTTGLSTMDYRITDPYLDPPELHAGWSTEKPLVLPETFWCYRHFERAPDVNALPALSTGQVTFGSQHSFHKIHRGVIALWARVLRSIEGSRLVLYAPQSAHSPIVKQFEQEHIEANRIEFLPLRARREYLAEYQRIDLSLDTFPYNGATTSLDAWYMGVPVLSLQGQTPVSRAGLSIATNLGLGEFVVTSEDDYVRRAQQITNHLERLNQLRTGLRRRMEQSPLMDAPRFTRNLEAAYRKVWVQWCSGGN